MSNSNVNKQHYNNFYGEGEGIFQYLEKSGGNRWFCALLSDLAKKIDSEEIHSIIDLGCGVGVKSALMAKLFPKAKVTGSDFAEPAIQKANEYWKYENLSFSTDDATKDDSNKYDIVCMFEVLEHIEDWKKMLDKIMVMSNKYIILSFPTGRMRPYEKFIGHYRNFVRGEVESYIIKNNFNLLERYNAGFPIWSPILRDITNLFYKEYAEVTFHKMSKIAYIGHYLCYILLRYFSLKKIGDQCLLLFKRNI